MDSSSISHHPSSYLTAPTSPDNLQFYSAPTSPYMGMIGSEAYAYDDDDFEFETSRRFANGYKCESSPTFDYCPVVVDDDLQQKHNQFQRANSFSTITMSFADELFSNGQVLPLKLPPRLQHATSTDTQGSSVPSSPKSLSSVLIRIPFGGRSTWNDNFDPFMVALDKVSDETIRGRKSIHRRARSLSPYRTTSPPPPPPIDHGWKWNQDQQKLGDSLGVPNTYENMVESKGSAYARWVRSQTMGHKRSSSSLVIGATPKGLTKTKTSVLFRKRGRVGDDGLAIKKVGEIERGFNTETKMQKVKSILLKYTSFGKENNQSAAAAMRKPSNYFKRLSFKFKGGIEKKKVSAGESKITALVKYNPKLPLCLGHQPVQNLQYSYSALTNPMGMNGGASYGYESEAYKIDDDFEFEAGQRSANGWEHEASLTFQRALDDERQQQQKQTQFQKANSFSTRAFADELFCNGQVLPLKVPPRLQHGTDGQGSIPTSPKSPSSVLRIPFGRRSTWNDNFDPFTVALEKVSDETRGRTSIHRRARSHSSFRTTTILCFNGSVDRNQEEDQHKQAYSLRAAQMQRIGGSHSNEMVEANGSAYGRWVRSQTIKGHKRSLSVTGASQEDLTKTKTFLFGRRASGEQEGPIVKTESEKEIGFNAETKMQKMKSILLKYASFGKVNSQSAASAAMRKPSNYFKRLSFKFRGLGDMGRRKCTDKNTKSCTPYLN